MIARAFCALWGVRLLALAGAAVFCATAAFSQTCVSPPAGLVGWWKAENNANDTAGTNNGTMVNGATFGTGEVGQAFSFNGNSQVMQVLDAPALNPTSALTLECWAKLTAFAGAGVSTTVIEKGGAADAVRQYEIGTVPSGGQHYFQPALWTSGGFQGPVGTTPIVLNTWYHAAITYDGVSVKLYVNGNLDCSAAITGTIPVSTHPLWIGGDLEDPYNTTGLVDEVSLYNRALSAAEVQSIYNAGTAGKCITPTAPSITTQPANQTIYVGQTAVFSVIASGLPTPSYQWAHNGTNLVGATGSSFAISGAQLSDAGNYAVTLTNVAGSITSSNAVLTVNPVSCTPPPSGMVAWWKGDGDATDFLGTYNGTLVNGATFGTGEVGQAFSFNGNSQVMQVLDAPALNPTSALTLECWAKLTAFAGAGVSTTVVEKGGAADAVRQYEIGTVPSGGQHYFQPALWTSGGFQGPVGTTPILLNTWYHVAITYDGASVKLYVNGNLDCSAAITGTIPVSTHPLWIGGDLEDPYNTTGLVDEVSLYNRALSAAEVASIYESGYTGKCAGTTQPSITVQPVNQTVPAFTTVSFTVQAAGTPTLFYQWAVNGTNISGATTSALTLLNVQTTDSGNYSVTITNGFGSITSSNAVLTVNPVFCTPPPSGLVAWWKAEGNANDSAGSNNGTFVGGSAFTGGEVGQSFSFNGGQLMQVVDSPALNPTNAITIEGWVNLTAYPGAGVAATVVEKGGASDSVRQYELGMVPSGGSEFFRAHVWTPGGLTVFQGITPLLLNTWYHVAMTYDGASLKLYLNGNLEGSAAVSGPIVTSTHPLWIGGDNEQPYNTTGKVDEVSLYNRALGVAEIQAIYNATAAGKCTGANPPVITTQPASQTVSAGTSPSFTVIGTGSPLLSYQWQFNGTNIAGATASILTLPNVQAVSAGAYSVTVTNNYGSAASSNATLAVNTAPFITAQPQSLTVAQGTPATFSVTAGGDSPLAYQWQFNTTNISGATDSSFAITSAQGTDAGSYRVKITNAWGSITSTSATLAVGSAPAITTQPASTNVTVGNSTLFTVAATGTAPLRYQWQLDGTNIAGATSTIFALSNVQAGNAGVYAVIVTNPFGATISSNAVLTVGPATCTPTPSGLVGWWPLNGDWTDLISGDTGIPTTTNFTTGKVGLAMAFNGSTSDVRIPASSVLNVGAGGGMSIEAWIKPNNVAGAQPLVEWNSNQGVFNGIGAQFWISVAASGGGAGSIWVNLLDSSLTPHQLSTVPGLVVTNVYQHVAMSYDNASGMLVIYLNGVAVAQSNLGSSFVPNTTSDVYLGLRPAGGGGPTYYNGALDEVSIYNRGLAAAEIQAIYAAGSAGKCNTGIPPSITQQPTNQTIMAGQSVSMTVIAAGSFPLSYQWAFGGTNINNATSSILNLSNVQLASSGTYSVTVTNAYGSVVSSNAQLTVNPPVCIPPPSGLVGWWQGEGTVLDEAGANHGAMINGGTYAPGEVGQAFHFNGVNQYALIPNAPALNPTNALTLEAWINIAAFNGGGAINITMKDDPFGTDRQYIHSMGLIGGKWVMRASVGVPTGLATCNGNLALQTNIWYHVAMTYDGTTLKEYVNGNLDGSLPVTGLIVPTSNPFLIGSETSGPWAFAGLVDEVSLYNRALSAAEIQSIYNASTAGKCQPTNPPSIVGQPANQSTIVGSSATFTVLAAGSLPLSYQWSFNGTNVINGATASSLTISNAQFTDAGNYSVTVTNAYGSATSSNALLTVNPPPSLIEVVSTTASSGIVSVPIDLVSQGDENALGFSINYSTARLTFHGVALSSNAVAAGAALLVNSNQLPSGRLGLAVSLPANAAFTSGMQDLVLVSFFAAASTNTQTATISFGDSPTLRQVVNPQAGILAANYASGTVTIPFLGFEGDVSPVPGGDGAVTIADWVQEGRFVAGLDTITNASLFQRADCAPRATLGDGQLTIADWVQVGRYAVGLDPLTPAGGPSTPNAFSAPSGYSKSDLGRTLTVVPPPGILAGQSFHASIQLNALGNENALGFSLVFNPAVLSFSSASVGSGAAGALFNANAYQAGSGKLGLALALPADSAFGAGMQEVAQVTFVVSPAATNPASITFANQPVFSQTVDPTATALSTTYVNGTLGITPQTSPPTLVVALTPDNAGAVVSWPASATGFNLEASNDLGQGNWSTVNAALVTNSTVISATIPLSGAQQFYRLHHP
jgi:hypothetical protein